MNARLSYWDYLDPDRIIFVFLLRTESHTQKVLSITSMIESWLPWGPPDHRDLHLSLCNHLILLKAKLSVMRIAPRWFSELTPLLHKPMYCWGEKMYRWFHSADAPTDGNPNEWSRSHGWLRWKPEHCLGPTQLPTIRSFEGAEFRQGLGQEGNCFLDFKARLITNRKLPFKCTAAW